MNLYIDLDRSQLVAGPSNSGPVSTLSFKRGDAAALGVTFQQLGPTGYVPVVLPAGTSFKLGLKVPGQYDGAFVVYCDAWTAPSGDGTAYTLQPSFNTTALNALLAPSGGGAVLSQAALMGEIAWIDPSGRETSTKTFSVVVLNDVIKDDEGVPSDATPPYPAPSALFTRALAGTVALAAGQSDYAIDLTPLGLAAPPQGALCTLVTPDAGASAFGAHMVASLSSAVSLTLHTDAPPPGDGFGLVYLLIP